MKTASPSFREAMTLALTILGTGMAYLDQTALNVALPAIQRDLQADLTGLQWVTDIYILCLAAPMLIGGALGDRYGRVRVYVVGMMVFVAASVLGALAPSLPLLILARALQGLGGALLIPGSFAIINTGFPPERRGRAMGIWGAFSPIVTLSGPLIGGWLVDNASWRAVFLLNLPLGLIAVFAARFVTETRDESATGPLDWPGVSTLLVGLGGLLFGLIEGAHFGWGHPVVLAALLSGAAGLVVFVIVEARSSALRSASAPTKPAPVPLLPLWTLRNRTFLGINVLTLIHYFAISSLFFFFTLNLQQAQRYSAFEAGLMQLPIPIILVLMSNPMGRLIDRTDPRRIIAAGVLLNALGLMLCGLPGVGGNYWLTFFPAQVVFGVGLGCLVIPLTAVAINALGTQGSGIASGLNTCVSRIAQMLAVAVFGGVMLAGFRPALEARIVGLELPAEARAQLLAEARNLGATQPPAGLSAETAAAVDMAVRLAFVDSFRQMMWLSAVIALLGLALWLAIVWREPNTLAMHNEPLAPEPTAD
ncbi:MAG: MFS transporter [Anaerolineales bacterium]|nr:MFS transporter [Anaerolineales bacterium]